MLTSFDLSRSGIATSASFGILGYVLNMAAACAARRRICHSVVGIHNRPNIIFAAFRQIGPRMASVPVTLCHNISLTWRGAK